MPNNILFDRVKMSVSGTPGTGTITLGSAATGYLSFAGSGVANTNVVRYLIEDSGDWEIGKGTYTSSGTTLSRDTVLLSSAGGTTKIAATSAAYVYITASTNDLVQYDSDGKIPIRGTTSGVLTITPPAAAGSSILTLPALTGTVLTDATAGTILQVVQGSTSTQASNTSTSYADTGLSATITPKFSTSKILVMISQNYQVKRSPGSASAADAYGGIKLVRGTTDIWSPLSDATGPYEIGIVAYTGSANITSTEGRWSFTYLDSPATTSATTYKTQFRPYVGSSTGETMVVQRTASPTNGSSYITLMEVAA